MYKFKEHSEIIKTGGARYVLKERLLSDYQKHSYLRFLENTG